MAILKRLEKGMGKNYVSFSVRVTPDLDEYINEYAYAKRLSKAAAVSYLLDKAIKEEVFKFVKPASV